MRKRGRLTVRLKRLTEVEIHKWTRRRNDVLTSSENGSPRKTSSGWKKKGPKFINRFKNSIEPIPSVEDGLESSKNVPNEGTFLSEFKMMQGALVEEIDNKNELIEVEEEEEEGAEQIEILELLGRTFLCTICGKTHSKNFSCNNYGIFKSEVFLCPNQDCGKIFESEIELKQHEGSCQVTDPLLIDTATFQDEDLFPKNGRKTKCSFCGQFFTRIFEHISRQHPKEVVKCRISNCRRFFVSEKNLLDHMLQFHSPIKCAHCNMVFEKKAVYIKHVYSKHGSKGYLKCSFRGCIHFFKSYLEMEKHYKQNHIFKAECDLCWFLAPTLTVLLTHMKRKHYPVFENFKTGKIECSYCGKFVKMIDMHLRLAHPEKMLKPNIAPDVKLQEHRPPAPKAIKCIICDLVFDKNYVYIEHVKNSHQGHKLFKCSFQGCIQFFKSYLEMEKHYKENHPFQGMCDLCGYLAPSLKVLLCHMNRSHYPKFEMKKINARKTQCSYCGKFISKMKEHLNAIHPEKMLKHPGTFVPDVTLQDHMPPACKSMKCNFCDLVFEKNYKYTRHVREMHRSYKLFKCSYTGCIHFFKIYPEMEKHYKENHPFQGKCDLCGYLASSLKILLDHMNRSHYPNFEMKKSNTRKTKCSYCGKFISKMKEHLNAIHPEKILKHPSTDVTLQDHMPPGLKTIKCFFCDLVFGKNYLYIRHVKNKHQGNKLFKCSFTGCIHFFKSQLEMENHYYGNHPFQAKCDLCGFLAPTMIEIMRHIQRKHYPTFENKKKNMKNSIATKSQRLYRGKLVKRIDAHLRSVHSEKILKRPDNRNRENIIALELKLHEHRSQAPMAIKCIICDLVFDKNYLYIQHVKSSHQGEKLFNCSFQGCILFFKSMLKMEKHYKKNHPFKGRCDLCGYLAPSLKFLLLHMKRSHYPKFEMKKSNMRKTKCSHCGKFIVKMKKHLSAIHPEKSLEHPGTVVPDVTLQDLIPPAPRAINCNFCDLVFDKNNVYMQHVGDKHHGRKLFKCSFTGCIHYFKIYSEMENHYNENHPLGARCDLCGFLAPTKIKILQHIQSRHDPKIESKKKSKCSLCGDLVISIKDHFSVVHPDKMLNKSQSSCCKNFLTEEDLQNHKLQAHTIKCVFCNLIFDKECMFTRHVKKSHQGHNLFKCSFKGCIHFFKSKVEMEKHYKESHPFQAKCDLCDYLAPSLKHLIDHMKRSHSQNIIGKIECSFCGKFFKNINIHKGRVHPEQMSKQPHNCSCCKILFETEVDLNNHMIQAHNAFKCAYCNQVFDKNCLYINHVKKKHARCNLYKCSFRGCIHFFQSQVKMEEHYKKNHPWAKCDLCGHLAPNIWNIKLHMFKKHRLTLDEEPNSARLVNNRAILDKSKETTPNVTLLAQITSQESSQNCTSCLMDIPLLQMDTHKKNTICTKCDKTYPCKGLLAEHTPTCFFQCSVCNKNFMSKYSLKFHKLTHNQVWKGLKHQALGLKCEECKMYFPNKYRSREHDLFVHKKKTKNTTIQEIEIIFE